MDESAYSGQASGAAAPPAARAAPPRARQPQVEQIDQIEEIEEIAEVEEVSATPSRAPARATSASPARDPARPSPPPARPAAPAAPHAESDAETGETDEDPSLRFRFRRWLRQSGAMFVSTIVHAAAIITLSYFVIESKPLAQIQEVIADSILEEPEKQDELKVELENQLTEVREQTTQVFSSSPVVGTVGASGPSGLVSAPTIDKALLEQVVNANVNVEGIFIDVPSSKRLIVQAPDGQVGDARAVVDSYQEALDRLTQEILWMMDKSKVLVVWVFDQSESMKDDQAEIRNRIEHVYTQLGLVSRHNEDALETAVVSFGKGYIQHTPQPTFDRSEIRAAIEEVPNDPSGEEMTCSAVLQAIATHRQYAQRTRRQMALVLVTDESGNRVDNDSQLERAIAEAKAARCKIYTLGREAVFGYPYAYMRWVHPQTLHVHWLQIDRGPETAFVEQLQTDGFHRRYDAHPSGFGYYECTRMSRETGGIFFMLPSLEVNLVHGSKRNYDMEAPYYPDLRTKMEVKADIDKSPMRSMLETVIYDLNPYNEQAQKIIEMRVEFPRDYPQFVPAARHEQAKAIVYLEYLARAEKTVSKMEHTRKQEPSPRWQANYDLLYAQLVAYQARMYEYGACLEDFIRNPKVAPLNRPPNLTHVHWDIRTCHTIRTGDTVKPYIERATAMFKDVIANHPSTPWAARAEFEINRGFGCELIPDYDGPHPQVTGPLIPVPKL
jgi:hypothetical protein